MLGERRVDPLDDVGLSVSGYVVASGVNEVATQLIGMMRKDWNSVDCS